MNAVVIGGHTRNIGKTSVMTGLISALKSYDWTAVKITQYGHGVCSLDGQPCECAPKEHAFALTEEHDRRGRADTSRYLAAGAGRSLWLRVRQGQLADAFPVLEQALNGCDWVMIESNSILELVRPVVYLLVLDSGVRDFKDSARRFLDRADALVPIESRLDGRAWAGSAGLLTEILQGKPVFPVSGVSAESPGAAQRYSSPALCDFVQRKLAALSVVSEKECEKGLSRSSQSH